MTLDLSKAIEAGARSLAELADGEPWPSNAELGGNPTGARDDEYRDGLSEQAADVIAAALPHILEEIADKAYGDASGAHDSIRWAYLRFTAEWLRIEAKELAES